MSETMLPGTDVRQCHETRARAMASERVRDTLTELYDLGREDGRRDAAAEISRLSRELEEARELLRELAGDDEAGLAWDGGWRCVYCDSRARYTVLHDGECPIVRARRVLANTDTAGPQSADREERRESD